MTNYVDIASHIHSYRVRKQFRSNYVLIMSISHLIVAGIACALSNSPIKSFLGWALPVSCYIYSMDQFITQTTSADPKHTNGTEVFKTIEMSVRISAFFFDMISCACFDLHISFCLLMGVYWVFYSYMLSDLNCELKNLVRFVNSKEALNNAERAMIVAWELNDKGKFDKFSKDKFIQAVASELAEIDKLNKKPK